MNTQEFLNVLKVCGATLFGILAMHGYMTQDQASALLSDLTIAVPALLSAGSVGWSIYSHWNMKKVPEHTVVIDPVVTPSNASLPSAKVQLPQGTVVGKVVSLLLIAFVLSAFLAGGAQAQVKLVKPTGNIVNDIAAATGKPPLISGASTSTIASLDATLNKLGQKLQSIEKDIADKVIADAKDAITDGNNHNDDISVPCWTAIQALAENLPAEWPTPPTQPMGIMLAIQVQRDLLAAITGQQKTSLKVACAALWGDQLSQIGQLGLLFGFTAL